MDEKALHIKPEHFRPKFYHVYSPPLRIVIFENRVALCSLYTTDSILRQGLRGSNRGTNGTKQTSATPYIIYCKAQ